MYGESNIYDSPEKHGLRVVRQFDASSGSYEFDLFVIWERKSDGRLFYGRDGGCSCPSPFENFTTDDLIPIGQQTWETFKRDLDAHAHDAQDASVGVTELSYAATLYQSIFPKVERKFNSISSRGAM